MPIIEKEPAAVTVRILENSFSRVHLESPYLPGLWLDAEGNPSAEAHDYLKERLDSLSKDIRGRLDLSWPDAHQATHALRELGLSLSSSMFFSPHSGRQFREYVRKCLGIFRAKHHRDAVPILNLEAPWPRMIPIEFYSLRTFDESSSQPRNDILDLRNRAIDLLGFQFVVRRRFPRVHATTRGSKQTIAMQFFWDNSLLGAVEEWKYLPQISESLSVWQPWPALSSDDAKNFVRMAYGAGPIIPLGAAGLRRGGIADIWHLACHCDTKANLSPKYYFRFRSDEHGKIDVSLNALQIGFSQLEEDGEFANPQRPLIFMNACGSSKVHPLASSSFPHFWLENGFAGCIGTEIAVDDLVASRFSRYFYKAITDGMSLGDAMYRARMGLLERHRNPLGILWTLYADPRFVLIHSETPSP